jgi:hypothetical protein
MPGLAKHSLLFDDDAYRAAAIDRLYAELRELTRGAIGRPGSDPEIARRLSELRQLQRDEAADMQRFVEARLHLKPGEGLSAVQRARELLTRDEAPSSSDAATKRQS